MTRDREWQEQTAREIAKKHEKWLEPHMSKPKVTVLYDVALEAMARQAEHDKKDLVFTHEPSGAVIDFDATLNETRKNARNAVLDEVRERAIGLAAEANRKGAHVTYDTMRYFADEVAALKEPKPAEPPCPTCGGSGYLEVTHGEPPISERLVRPCPDCYTQEAKEPDA